MDLEDLRLWSLGALVRFRLAVRGHWRRILVGAVAGWLLAVVLGAASLAWLEVHEVISRETADELGVILVLYGVGLGALDAYALRSARPHRG